MGVRERRGEEERKKMGKGKVLAEEVAGIKQEEVQKAIRRLKKGKAAGGDRIGNDEWIYGGEELESKMTTIVNEIWKGKGIPDEWKEGIIHPVYKKGDKDIRIYRSFTLMDTGYKIYEEILRNRLETHIEEKEKLDDTQWGFRRGRGY